MKTIMFHNTKLTNWASLFGKVSGKAKKKQNKKTFYLLALLNY